MCKKAFKEPPFPEQMVFQRKIRADSGIQLNAALAEKVKKGDFITSIYQTFAEIQRMIEKKVVKGNIEFFAN